MGWIFVRVRTAAIFAAGSIRFRGLTPNSTLIIGFPKLLYFLLVPAYITAARHFTAFAAFQIVGGIDGSAFGAGIMVDHLLNPFFISGFLDPCLRFPQLDSVRSFRLEGLQILTRILRAGSAEVHPFGCGACGHFAFALAVIASLLRPATLASQFFHGTPTTLGEELKPFRVFLSPDKEAAGWTKQAADSGKFLINLFRHVSAPQLCLSFRPSPISVRFPIQGAKTGSSSLRFFAGRSLFLQFVILNPPVKLI
jgi:hypothetical protein